MKKTLLVMAICLLTTATFAQKITVKSGDLKFLKSETEITAEFTYEKMRVGAMTEADYTKKKSMERDAKSPGTGEFWVKQWEGNRESFFEPKFMELWNKHIPANLPQISKNGETKYIVRINTDFTEPGFNVYIHRKNASVNLTLTFIEAATNTTKAVVTVLNSPGRNFGGDDFDSASRIEEAYAKAGKEMGRLIASKAK